MTKDANMQAQRCAEGHQLMLQGMALVFGSVKEPVESMKQTLESLMNQDSPNHAEEHVQPAKAERTDTADPNESVPQQTAPAPQPPGGKPLTKSDIQRAMALKIKELAKNGQGPDAVRAQFQKFHNATCVSDLTPDDYPGFLAELEKL